MAILRIGHSPDADDAFMYYAIAHGKVRVGSYQVEHVLEDIESLNKRALKGELEVTAISAAVYPQIADKYRIMRVGASIGRNYGPIVVAKTEGDLMGATIGIPGLNTTAYLLLRLYLKEFKPVPMAFDRIIPAVQEGQVKAGLIIHEGQLTYGGQGLKKLMDMGQSWFKETGLPIPLGLDMVRRDLGEKTSKLMNTSLKESIEYAYAHEDEALQYAVKFSRGADVETCRRFVKMYVNQDTLDMGEEGKRALETLYRKAQEHGIIPNMPPIDLI